jgi:DNA processing protein
MNLPHKWNDAGLVKLHFYKGLTPTLIKEIVDKYHSYEHFLNADLPEKLNLIVNQGELFRRGIKKPETESVRQLDLAEKHDIKLISIWDAEYPSLLKEIYSAPPLLFVKGNLQTPSANCVSIVGTRKCSNYGRINTERFAEFFSKRNIIVVSGLAYGIDSIAHNSVVNSGGTTYAVIASGIDKLSPSTSVKNAERIIETGGAIISTYMCGTPALPAYFLQRNRIIAGISKATLVVESRIKGGSLNTAKFARDENRELYAMPGNITSPNSEGTNDLISRGLALLAYSPEQIYKELSFAEQENLSTEDIATRNSPQINFTNENEKIIYENLSYEPIHVDQLTEKCKIDISTILVNLLNLEFSGAVKQLPGKYYIIAI